jgi:hypothetical protein
MRQSVIGQGYIGQSTKRTYYLIEKIGESPLNQAYPGKTNDRGYK